VAGSWRMMALRAQKCLGVNGIAGSGMAWGAQRHGLGDDDGIVGMTASPARVREDGDAYRGARSWSGTIVQRLRGALDDSVGSREVDDGAGSREVFSEKFWQPDNVSESLRGLGFVKVTERFIYRGTISSTGTGDVSRPIATKDHSSDRLLPPSAHCYCNPYMYSAILM
jgi:hypothetical protein